MEQKKTLNVIVIDDTPERAEELMNWLRRGEYGIRPRYLSQSGDLTGILQKPAWDMLLVAGRHWPAEIAKCAMAIEAAGLDMVLIAVDDLEAPATTEEIDAAVRVAGDIVPRRENRLIHAVHRDFHALVERRRRRALNLALKSIERRCRSLILNAPAAIAYVTPAGHTLVNAAYLHLFGYARMEDLAAVKLEDLIAAGEREKLRAAMHSMNAEGSTRPTLEITGLRADKSEIKLQMEILSAIHDRAPCLQIRAWHSSASTEILPHASAAPASAPSIPRQPAPRQPAPKGLERFTADIDACIVGGAQSQQQAAFLYVEIVRWERLRTAVGEAIYQILTDLEALIKRHAGNRYSLAVIDEHALAILLPKTGIPAAKEFATRLQQLIDDRVFEVADRALRVTTQMGLVRITDLYTVYPEVLEDARQACRIGLLNGHRVEIYGDTLSETQRSLSQVGLDSFIDRAIANRRLSLVYQPLLGLQEHSPAMYETLLRMQDEVGTNVPMAALFAAARVQAATSPLDHWIVDQVINVLQREETHPDLRLFIKVESESIKSESLLLILAKHLRERHVAANRLVIEISETILSQDPSHARAFLSSLRTLGCGVAIEHFGISLSALRLLEGLPVDYVKIDATLIAHMTQEPESAAAVQAIVKQARSQGMITIAESVNDAPTLIAVANAGIEFALGIYIQEPSPVMDFDFTSHNQ